MHLYLIRHAEPVPPSDDNSPLSTAGRAQADKLGALFSRLYLTSTQVRIVASGRRRAQETGERIRAHLNPLPGTMATYPSLASLNSHNPFPVDVLMTKVSALVGQHTEIIVIGHLDYVGPALNWLLGNNSMEWPNNYGATACVECASITQGIGRLRWFVLPSLLG